MPLSRWQATIVDDAGNIAPSASVTVALSSSGALASIFADETGTTPASNPLTADAQGFVFFYAAGTAYRITAASGLSSRVWEDVQLGDSQRYDVGAVSGNIPTVDDLAAVAISGAYADLTGTPIVGTAASRNVGTGGADLPDTTQLNVRLNTSGNLGTAAQRGVGTASNELPDTTQLDIRLGTAGNLGTAATSDAGDFATAAQGTTADTAVQPGDLATVATSGAYGDLSGLPTLGTAAARDVGTGATDVPDIAAGDGRYGRLGTSNTWTGANNAFRAAQTSFETVDGTAMAQMQAGATLGGFNAHYLVSIGGGALTHRPIALRTNSNTVLVAHTTGNVSIGTAVDNGVDRVQVNGTISATKFIPTGGTATGNGVYLPATNTLALSTNGAERVRVTSAGNVGIGTSAPTFQLQTSADAQFHGVRVGRGAGGISNNTAAGGSALNANTTGAANTAVGVNALLNNTTGPANTALGVNALLNNTTSGGNTAVGASTLTDNTTGALNSAFGLNALLSNTTGGSNTAVGVNAGRYFGAGTDNLTVTNNSVFVGVLSRANADNSSNEIVIGHEAIGAGNNTATLGNTSITQTVLRGDVSGAKFIPTGGTATGNGVYLPAANTLALSTNGSERVRITSTGNTLIGTTTDNGEKLRVYNGTAVNTLTATFTAGGSDPGFRAGFANGGSASSGYGQEHAKVGMFYSGIVQAMCHFGFLRGGGAAGAGITANVNALEVQRWHDTGNTSIGTPTDNGTERLQANGAISATTYIKPGSFTVATVPSASASGAGAMIYVSNETGGAVIAFSDGTNWLRCTDRAIVS